MRDKLDKKMDALKSWRNHGDFHCLFHENDRTNIWLLGYFGGGLINIFKAMEVAKEYAELNKVSIESIVIGEISKSRSFKYFRYIYSSEKQEPMENSINIQNFADYVE